MKYDHILVRYGELALKGKNRKEFEKKVQSNMRNVIQDHPTAKVRRTHGRMMVEVHDEDPHMLIEKLRYVFGISSLSLALKVQSSYDEILNGALAAFQESGQEAETFKVDVRRAYKTFPMRSQELAPKIGAHILQHTENVTVDVHHPDVEVNVELREQGTYITCGRVEGLGGLPVGTSGRVLLMLSGGIDSPVAGYLSLKRGASLEAIHFHSPPYTNERAKQKVEDLASQLSVYGGKIRLHIVPFTDLQKAIHQHVPPHYAMTVMRRMMMRIAERLAEKREILALANGESLGQVASQTLESMHAINEVTNMPILRPLVTMDKQEVIEISQEIGTYETSVLPYEDCCTVFLPENSKTRPKRDKVSAVEEKFDFEPYIQAAVEGIEAKMIEPHTNADEVDELL
ncbi:thiamine biosynthesis protein ThiI [Salsuginibacillus halophilus]|uniref:Probable tRNA sulfurtransferase n=1 Tax=Salsuginibacillus halophilus TaxID=517424 RepID=A0A2P8HBP0_9BACI|nr:tRNA uracil 4-sulfurtransferase ThiI [Salsuginibacillus halophilus]PSL43626.1 thiamine biosynthesis protein ThiI [Salsuginibacillus halophilus]